MTEDIQKLIQKYHEKYKYLAPDGYVIGLVQIHPNKDIVIVYHKKERFKNHREKDLGK